MTATTERPRAIPDHSESSSEPQPDSSLVLSTLVIAVGLVLTTLPLESVFRDWSWLTGFIGCALPYWFVVTFFRTRSQPLWWHSLLGLIGSGLVLLWIFVPQHLLAGIVPTPDSLSDVGTLISDARRSLRVEHTPVEPTTALRFITAGLLVMLAALTDILGVGLRRPVLAGAPMLEILAVASTTSSHATRPIWFIAACIGFLLILLTGTRLQDRLWGTAVDGSEGRLAGARSIAVVAVAAAMVIPVVLPGRSANLIAKATHHAGNGSGGQTVLSNLASLRGSLKRGTPIPLFTVQVGSGDSPFYVRQSVLDTFTNSGWVPSDADSSALTPLSDAVYPVSPSLEQQNSRVSRIAARFTISGLGGKDMPVLANPSSVSVQANGTWNSRDATVTDVTVKRGLQYSEAVDQPDPTVTQLNAATAEPPKALSKYVALPKQPGTVTKLAATIAAGKSTPYQKALAISDYFTNGLNGFVYSLDAPAADSGNALVDFLTAKKGFCQQYAAAAAVLMRQAGIPTRVVIGYTHAPPDVNNTFTVTTRDAHAWVESYFTGIGWVAFDPTPLSGSEANRARVLPYAQHTTPAVSSVNNPRGGRSSNAATSVAPSASNATSASTAATGVGSNHQTRLPWWILIVLGPVALLLLIAMGPRLIRSRQRRRRLDHALREHSAEPLWREVAASAVDQGALWPDTFTVGQVPDWLVEHGMDERGRIAVIALAGRVAEDRFSGQERRPLITDEVAGLDEALRRWAKRAERRERVLFRWLPRSLITRTRNSRR